MNVTETNVEGLHRELKVVVGADDVTRHKPDPEPVHHALAALGADPSDTVFVGDSHHDVASGKAAGVRTIAVCWGPIGRERLALSEPHCICATTNELLATLGL